MAWRLVMMAACFLLAGAPVIFGQTNLPPQVDATAPAQAGAGGDAAKHGAVKEKEPLPVSIFFSPEEEQRIRAALIAYERSKQVKVDEAENKANDFLNQLTDTTPAKPAEPQQTTFVYPQFFMNSLAYHGVDDWMVIINNQRFSSHTVRESDELSILELDDEKALIVWHPRNMERVRDAWAKEKNEQTVVDLTKGAVTFVLRPNQTFSSYNMRVLEGKVKPVSVTLASPDNSQPGSDTSPQGAATSPPAGANTGSPSQMTTTPAQNNDSKIVDTGDIKNDVGVEGLNKTYKRMGLEN